MTNISILPSGEVQIGDQLSGVIDGLRFIKKKFDNDTEIALSSEDSALVLDNDLSLFLQAEYHQRLNSILSAKDDDFALSDGKIRWLGQTVAAVKAGDDIFKPDIILLIDDMIADQERSLLQERLIKFLYSYIDDGLEPLLRLKNADFLAEHTRYIADQIVDNLGILPRHLVSERVRALDNVDRQALRRLGVRFGAFHIFLPLILKPQYVNLLIFLWALKNDASHCKGCEELSNLSFVGCTSLAVNPDFLKRFYNLAGYKIIGERAIRVDILERLFDMIRSLTSFDGNKDSWVEGIYGNKQFYIITAMLSSLGVGHADMVAILTNLGYQSEEVSKDDFDAQIANISHQKLIDRPIFVGSISDRIKEISDNTIVGADKKPILIWRYVGRKREKKKFPSFSKKRTAEKFSHYAKSLDKSFDSSNKESAKPTYKKLRFKSPHKDRRTFTKSVSKSAFAASCTTEQSYEDSPFAALQQLKPILKQ